MSKPTITKCPTCGSRKIARVRRDITGTFRGKAYVARNVEVEECPKCGERLFDLEAMAKIEAARKPGASKRRAA